MPKGCGRATPTPPRGWQSPGGCTNYQTALHLMRTGAAGVVVGVAADEWSTTAQVLGIEVPMATAIVDAAAARRDYLDETGGRYVHVIAAGGVETSGDIAKALACGADAVMLGEPLAMAAEAPPAALDRYFYFEHVATHDSLFRYVVRGVLGEAPTRDKAPYLDELRERGVFLIDMCEDPFAAAHRDALPPCRPGLVRRCLEIAPRRGIRLPA